MSILQVILANSANNGTAVPPPVPGIDLNNANLVADGNSYLSNGGGAIYWPDFIIASEPFASNGATMHNFGVSGQTTEQMLSDQSSQILPLYSAENTSILLVCEGGNDIYFFGSAATAYNNMKTYCNNAKAAGFKVILTTCIPRDQSTAFPDDSASFNTKLVAFNNFIIADSSFYDALIRPDLDPLFANYDTGGYSIDRVHPSITGAQKFAELYITAMTNLTS